jgi:hypothetical protein
MGELATDARWQPPAVRAHPLVWTDDYSDLASYLIWGRRPPRSRNMQQ